RVDEFSHHCRRYERTDLLAKVRAAGLDLVRCTSYFMATLPFAIASRRRHRNEAKFDSSAELRMPKSLNTALWLSLRPESWLVKAGISVPVGSSLMLLARRPPL